MDPDFAIVASRSLTLRFFVPQSEISRRNLQHCLVGRQKQTMTAAAGKKLYCVVCLAPIHFKAEGQAAVGRLHFASRSAALNLIF